MSLNHTFVQTGLGDVKQSISGPTLLPSNSKERALQLKEKYIILGTNVADTERDLHENFSGLARWERFPRIYDIGRNNVVSGEYMQEKYLYEKKIFMAISNYPIRDTSIFMQLVGVADGQGGYELKFIPQNEISNKDITIFSLSDENLKYAQQLIEVFYQSEKG